jgi:hypothetical protein
MPNAQNLVSNPDTTARLKWDALSPEEKMKAGSRDLHSTPGPYKPHAERSPGGPFAAWGR